MEGERTILSSISRLPLRHLSSIRSTTTHLRLPCPRSTDAVAASPLHTSLSALPQPLIHIHKAAVIACLRAPHIKTAVEAAQAALTGGVSVLEIVMSTPGALEVIKVLSKDYPSVKLGVGTVLNIEDARRAAKAGAQFFMSPCTVMDILHWFRGSEILYMPGAMTPTEIFSAYNAGAEAIKIYPVSALGGDKYISTLRKPFPTIPMIASQGITTASIRNYINAGASAVVLSDAIFAKQAMIKQDFGEIKRLAELATIEASTARKCNAPLGDPRPNPSLYPPHRSGISKSHFLTPQSHSEGERREREGLATMAARKPGVIALFDVDGTLTAPRKVVTEEMLQFLKQLREVITVGVVGGSDLVKISEQLGNSVTHDYDYVFSENGLVAHKNGQLIGTESMKTFVGDEKLKEFINFTLHYIADLDIPIKRGTFIEFRSGMINVSPIGRNCSQEERDEFEKYDKIHNIRPKMVSVLREKFAHLNFTFSIGGQISFDVFPQGWDKTYCLRYLEEFQEIHFFGDKTYKGGNDHEIYESERTVGHTVTSPADTVEQCRSLFLAK